MNKAMRIAATALALAATSAVSAQGTSSANAGQAPGVRAVEPVRTQAMQQLQRSADRLRESIQTLAQQPQGPARDTAMDKAREALRETQQAMLALPPELRSHGTVSAVDNASVDKLMQAADSLRFAIQEMATKPAGEARNRAIETANRALLDTQMAMASAYRPGAAGTQAMGAAPAAAGGSAQPKGAGTGAANAPGQSKGGGAPVTALVILPIQAASDQNLANGCWVRFYDDKNFRGDTLTLTGPVDMAKMELPGGVWRDWDSARVGPRATVITYDNENFRERTATLRAGAQVGDLDDKKLGWFDEVKSARVQCQA